MFHARRVGSEREEEARMKEKRKKAGKVREEPRFVEGHSLYKDFGQRQRDFLSPLSLEKSLFIHLPFHNFSYFRPYIQVLLLK